MWRRGWDSNPYVAKRISNLQIPNCQRRQHCRLCCRPLPTAAQTHQPFFGAGSTGVRPFACGVHPRESRRVQVAQIYSCTNLVHHSLWKDCTPERTRTPDLFRVKVSTLGFTTIYRTAGTAEVRGSHTRHRVLWVGLGVGNVLEMLVEISPEFGRRSMQTVKFCCRRP